MKTVIELLKHTKEEARKLGKYELSMDMKKAIDILDGYEEREKRREEERRFYETMANMSPWEQKSYIDSWNGHGG